MMLRNLWTSKAARMLPITVIAAMLMTACGGTAATNTTVPATTEPTAMVAVETPTAMVAESPTAMMAAESPTAMMAAESPTAMMAGETPTGMMAGETPTAMMGSETPGAMMTPGLSVHSTNVTMKEQNGSGENGTATITDMGGGNFEVKITLSNGTTEAQPAHIHNGTCANLDPSPLVPLTSVVNGTSTTDVPMTMTMADLLSSPHAINVHKSAAEVSTYVSCGDITGAMMGSETPGAMMETPGAMMSTPGAMMETPGAMTGTTPVATP